VAPGIRRITQPLGERWLHLYLVEGARPLLVDSGLAETPQTVLLPALAALGRAPAELGTLLLTHPDVDHCGGSAAVRREAPGASLVGHAADRALLESALRLMAERYGWYEAHDLAYPPQTLEWIRGHLGPDTPLSRTVAEGEALDPAGLDGRDVRVLHLPGHSPGHLGVWVAAEGTAIIGDAILERGLYDVNGRRISPPPYFATAPYLATIEHLTRLAPRCLLTAHYPALRGPAVERFLEQSRAFVLETGQAVTGALREARRPLTLKELTAAVDARVGPFSVLANELAGPVRAHLNDLVGAGQARPAPDAEGGLPAWEWTGAA
jgi:glyoxylase-like metal-dependent hydrolase (beta-lactamase superfamily II)